MRQSVLFLFAVAVLTVTDALADADQFCDGLVSNSLPVENSSGGGMGLTEDEAIGEATDAMCGGAACAQCPSEIRCDKDITVTPSSGSVTVTTYLLWEDPDLWYAIVEVDLPARFTQTCQPCS